MMKVQKLFKSLVESAIDFANKSLDELKKGNPKHSLIGFCTALELFLKARLMLEHWTLVVSNSTRASPQTFEQGNFHSVSMEEAIERLEKVVGQRFSVEEKKIFETIRELRNRMVHFFDPGSATRKKRNLQKVAAAEYRGWYYLHTILKKRWSKEFKHFKDRIDQLGSHLHQTHSFLETKFDELRSEIKKEQVKGLKHKKCPSCRFTAYRPVGGESSPGDSELSINECMVCELKEEVLTVDCPDCGRPVEIRDMGEGDCRHCGDLINTDDLVDMLAPSHDPKEEGETAFCSVCERPDIETVVPCANDYLCVSCFSRFDRIGNCGFCNARNADIDYTDSYLAGCVVCSGMMAEDHT